MVTVHGSPLSVVRKWKYFYGATHRLAR